MPVRFCTSALRSLTLSVRSLMVLLSLAYSDSSSAETTQHKQCFPMQNSKEGGGGGGGAALVLFLPGHMHY